MKNQRLMPAAQFDALKAAAEKNGGVGSGDFFDREGKGKCGYGLACDAGLLTVPTKANATLREMWLVEQSARRALPFGYMDSDDAVRVVRGRCAGPRRPNRVPFDAWAEELGLTRGE